MDSITSSLPNTSPEDCNTIREKSKLYWKQFEPTLNNIMCTNAAASINDEEADEILSCLPSCKGGKVLELGAGIGRHTTRLAEISEHVLAVDFVEEFTEANESTNKHLGNVSFLCADVMKLNLQDESFDLIFSSWLLHYLLDPDIEKLTKNIFRWLKPNGFYFCRESCYAQVGSLHKQGHTAKYRPPSYYLEVVQKLSTEQAGLKIQHAANVFTYVRTEGSPHQIMMLFKKVTKGTDPKCSLTRMEFDKHPLSAGNIQEDVGRLRSLWLLPSLENELQNLLTRMGLIANQQVLMSGFGITEIPFRIAGYFDVFVRNVDYKISSFLYAFENQGKQDLAVRRKVHNIFSTLEKPNLPVQQYDVIICEQDRYTLEKLMTVAKMAKELLRPSGYLVFAASVNCASNELCDGIHSFHKDIVTLDELRTVFRSCSFTIKESDSKRHLLVEGLTSVLQNTNTKSELQKVEAELTLLQNGTLDWRTIIAQKL